MLLGRLGSLLGFVIFITICALAFGYINQTAIAPITQEQRNNQWVAANATQVVSVANVNNSIATAQIIDANGNYIVNAANATAIVANSPQGSINIYKDGQGQGMRMFGFGSIGFVVAGIVIFLVLVKH